MQSRSLFPFDLKSACFAGKKILQKHALFPYPPACHDRPAQSRLRNDARRLRETSRWKNGAFRFPGRRLFRRPGTVRPKKMHSGFW